MAKTTDFLTFMVDVTPYEHEGQKFDALNICVKYRKGHGFGLWYQPVTRTSMGFMTGLMSSDDPLVKSTYVLVKEVTRNNVTMLESMLKNLKSAADCITFLFDHREWKKLNAALANIANCGYTDAYRRQFEKFKAECEKAADKAEDVSKNELSPKMKQFYDLKSKHPDTILLFRCGDFYECYEKDAEVAANVLSITLTKDNNGQMAGFPHHALHTYLPKLVRAGKRVAICDQLEDPKLTKKLVKRGITELVQPAIINENTSTTKNQTTMATKNQTKKESKKVANAQVNNFDVTVDEVQDIVPTVNTKAEEPVEVSSNLPEVKFSTYKTKKGDTAPQIIGFAGEDDPRWNTHRDSKEKWVSAGYARDINGENIYRLIFGTRYMDVAKALCEAYNTADRKAWKRAEKACQANYESIVKDYKAENEARKAERKAKKNETVAATAAASTEEQAMFELFKKFMAGDKDAIAQVSAVLEKAA